MFRVSRLEEGEEEINKWLKTQPHIDIHQVNSSLYNSQYDTLLTVFYSDRKDKLNNLNILKDNDYDTE
jgi:hypothetical protein